MGGLLWKNEIKQLEDKAKSEQAAAKTTVTENPNNVEDSAGSTEKWGEEVERITRRHREEIERIQEGHRFELHRVTNELKTRPEPPPSIQVQNVTDQNVVNAYEEKIQILTQANEEKLKEVRLEAAQQIKDAYERKLETIKEKAGTLISGKYFYGYTAGLTFFIAVFATNLFDQGIWQRVYAAKSNKDLVSQTENWTTTQDSIPARPERGISET